MEYIIIVLDQLEKASMAKPSGLRATPLKLERGSGRLGKVLYKGASKGLMKAVIQFSLEFIQWFPRFRDQPVSTFKASWVEP